MNFKVKTMCKVLCLQRNGYYAWLKKPVSDKEKNDLRLLEKIKEYRISSDYIYGSYRIYNDLRENGEYCGLNRVAKLMSNNGIKAKSRYETRKFIYGKPSVTCKDVQTR